MNTNTNTKDTNVGDARRTRILGTAAELLTDGRPAPRDMPRGPEPGPLFPAAGMTEPGRPVNPTGRPGVRALDPRRFGAWAGDVLAMRSLRRIRAALAGLRPETAAERAARLLRQDEERAAALAAALAAEIRAVGVLRRSPAARDAYRRVRRIARRQRAEGGPVLTRLGCRLAAVRMAETPTD